MSEKWSRDLLDLGLGLASIAVEKRVTCYYRDGPGVLTKTLTFVHWATLREYNEMSDIPLELPRLTWSLLKEINIWYIWHKLSKRHLQDSSKLGLK